jgi:hypothetical protein
VLWIFANPVTTSFRLQPLYLCTPRAALTRDLNFCICFQPSALSPLPSYAQHAQHAPTGVRCCSLFPLFHHIRTGPAQQLAGFCSNGTCFLCSPPRKLHSRPCPVQEHPNHHPELWSWPFKQYSTAEHAWLFLFWGQQWLQLSPWKGQQLYTTSIPIYWGKSSYAPNDWRLRQLQHAK